VALRLIEMGFQSTALLGGFDAWAERYPVEPVQEAA
jgi:hypothetical protein